MKGLFFTPIDIISKAIDLIQIPFQAVVLKGDFYYFIFKFADPDHEK